MKNTELLRSDVFTHEGGHQNTLGHMHFKMVFKGKKKKNHVVLENGHFLVITVNALPFIHVESPKRVNSFL